MDYLDPNSEFILFILVLLLITGVGALIYMLVWMIRSPLEISRYRAERDRETERLRCDAHEADQALVNDMLDWGIPYDELMAHRHVYTDHRGVDTVEYTLPQDQIAERLAQAARVHRQLVDSFGGRQPAPVAAQAG